MKLNSIRVKCTIDGRPYSFKSRAEYRFACWLEFLRKNGNIHHWEYESREFWFNEAGANLKRGCVSYKPDFMVYELQDREHTITWYEVKGYMDQRSQTKIKRFRKYFPKENLILIDSSWFKRNSKKLKHLVPGWV